jgi:Zn-dependent peptidase ImmA (M78 family)
VAHRGVAQTIVLGHEKSMTRVNPAILLWARETSGLTLEQAAPKVGLRDTKYVSAVTRLGLLETGVDEPTRPMLLAMSKAYRRPLLTFYLPEPPARADRGEDFRSLPDDRRAESAAAIDALLRDVRARQAGVRAILEDEETPPLSFVGCIDIDIGPKSASAFLIDTIGFDKQEFRKRRGVEEAFRYVRSQAEAAGIFVLLIGNLGSHHSSIDPEVFRGIAIADPIAPFIVINDQDAKSAWSFTLLHEIAHLMLGATGISNAFADGKLEQFCNNVASLVLVAEEEVGKISSRNLTTIDEIILAINEIANGLNVSRSAIAYRLYLNKTISGVAWRSVSKNFREEYLQERAAIKSKESRSKSGPDYYVVKRHKLGSPLLALVKRNLDGGNITPTRAAKILGVKARNVDALISRSAA